MQLIIFTPIIEMPAIPNFVFVLLIAIATGYLTFLTTKGGLTDNRFSDLWNRLTKRGKTVLAVLIFIAILLLWQEMNNEAVSKEKDRTLKNERGKIDSTITAGIDAGVEAFKKQEVRLDTVAEDIKKIKDLSKSDYRQVDPVLLIDSNGIIQKSKSTYVISFTSHDAASANYDLSCHVLFQYANGTYGVENLNFFPKGLRISKDHKWETSFYTDNLNDVDEIEFYVKGTYTTLDGVKKYNVNDVYSYDLTVSTVNILTENKRNEIINIINKAPKR